jgi:peptide/nickel transport system ATP-binding protein
MSEIPGGDAVLEVRDLDVATRRRGKRLPIVEGLSFTVQAGEVLGIVGESGSGKTMTAKALMGLTRFVRGLEVQGSVRLRGRELLDLPESELARLRGRDVAMVFQDSLRALNPLQRVGSQVAEVLRLHTDLDGAQIEAETVRLLADVGIPHASERVRDYPHQFSGGMRQRAMIACALACDPGLLIADEPTTALDVTIQAQILRLLSTLAEQRGSAVLLITHDLGVITEIADRVLVMYGGRAVECGATEPIMTAPQHPYTWGLLDSIPSIDRPRGQSLPSIPGSPPSLETRPTGCPFRTRCAHVFGDCGVLPPLRPLDSDAQHLERCWLPRDVRAARHRKGVAP